MNKLHGGCSCGAVRYVLSDRPKATTVCHCTRCQKNSGSAFSVNLVMSDKDYAQSGETTTFADVGDSGNPVLRQFCAKCGSPITTITSLVPGHIVVKAGTLDELDAILPTQEIYTDHAVKWLPPIANARRSAQNN